MKFKLFLWIFVLILSFNIVSATGIYLKDSFNRSNENPVSSPEIGLYNYSFEFNPTGGSYARVQDNILEVYRGSDSGSNVNLLINTSYTNGTYVQLKMKKNHNSAYSSFDIFNTPIYTGLISRIMFTNTNTILSKNGSKDVTLVTGLSANQWYEFEIFFDFANKKYKVYMNKQNLRGWLNFYTSSATRISNLYFNENIRGYTTSINDLCVSASNNSRCFGTVSPTTTTTTSSTTTSSSTTTTNSCDNYGTNQDWEITEECIKEDFTLNMGGYWLRIKNGGRLVLKGISELIVGKINLSSDEPIKLNISSTTKLNITGI